MYHYQDYPYYLYYPQVQDNYGQIPIQQSIYNTDQQNFYNPVIDTTREHEHHFECPHKLCHVNERSILTFTELDTIYEEDYNRQDDRQDFKTWRKEIWSYNYPEVKTSNCEKVIKTKNPFGGWISHTQKYPCLYRRTSNAKAFLEVKYPATAEAAVKEHIETCGVVAAGVASKSIYAAVSASSATGVGVVPVAIAAVPAALKLAGESFTGCIQTYNIAHAIRRLISTKIVHEKKTGEWKRV